MAASPRNHTYITNIAKLATGSSAAQLIGLLSNIVISRIYSPETFGISSLVVSSSAILAVIATLRFQFGIVASNTIKEKQTLTLACFYLSLFSSALIFVSLYTIKQADIEIGEFSITYSWLFYIPTLTLTTSSISILTNYRSSVDDFTRIAYSTIFQTTTRSATSIALGLQAATATNLILSQVAGQISAILKLSRERNFPKAVRAIRATNRTDLFAALTINSKYAKYDLWADILNVASSHASIFVIAAYYGAATGGHLSLTQRVIILPISLLGGAIGQVYFKKANDIKSDKEAAKALSTRTYYACILISLVPLSILHLFGEPLFAYAFGPDWTTSGEMAAVMIIGTSLQFTASPLSAILWVNHSQEKTLLFCALLFTVRIASLLIPIQFGCPIEQTIYIFSLSSAILWFAFALQLLSTQGIKLVRPALFGLIPFLIFIM